MAAMTRVDNDQGAFREGLFVRALGRPCNSNPYQPSSDEAVLWDMGWRLIDAGRDGVPSTGSVVLPVRPDPELSPGDSWADFRSEYREPSAATASPRGRLVDAAIVLTFVAMLVGMWMMTMR
jgi:hypothetical protein